MGFVRNIRDYLNRHTEKYSAFFEGMGSLNILGYYSKPTWMKDDLTPEQQDALAIRGDWEKVGVDLEKAINDFKKK
ncbi:MAG: hypothetical protein NTZ83_03845 [Candidatus Pacearchaeota archaeon]|nr:hypothetical protein [Candidatus Pacearchaeota archaeon]